MTSSGNGNAENGRVRWATEADVAWGPEDLVTLEELAAVVPLEDTPVLVRADLNVPLKEKAGSRREIADDFRIRVALPTLEWLVNKGAQVTVISHLGRPRGKPVPELSMEPVREYLEERLSSVRVLENLRFDPREEEGDISLARELCKGQVAFVNEAFGCSHRAHASIIGPPKGLPSAAGRRLLEETSVLMGLRSHAKHPFVAVVGGAKVADKLGLLAALAARVDELIIGGGMAYTFLAAMGRRIGESLFEPEHLDLCREILLSGVEILLPEDFVVLSPGGKLALHGEEPTGEVRVVEGDIPDGWEACDIGPSTVKSFSEAIRSAATVLWNGPMGAFEDPRFASGTKGLGEALQGCSGFSVVGGGDTVAALDALGLAGAPSFTCSGGGASLELLEQGDLPGLKALREASKRLRQGILEGDWQ
jgi:phosphoglycerate kinase